MNLFYSEFPIPSKLDWEAVLRKELKGENPSEKLNYSDDIEGIEVTSYLHDSDVDSNCNLPSQYPFTRSSKIDQNDWSNGFRIEVFDEVESNKAALKQLMNGAEGLIFELKKDQIDFDVLFKDIQLEFISLQLVVLKKEQIEKLISITKSLKKCFYSIDFSIINFDEVAVQFIANKQAFCFVDAYQIQQIGGNIEQELAFSLSKGHDFLVRLMSKGLKADVAASLIHFNLGVGARYFNEIAKFRVFRKLWSFIIKQYTKEKLTIFPSHISAEIGFLNKSLLDPYTNLLRQTTEAMSAVLGGVDLLIVNPYDRYSTNGVSDFTQRMALNISLILKEESFFDKVIDPTGGSYLIDRLTSVFTSKSWVLFQELDDLGGVMESDSAEARLIERVKKTVEKRILKAQTKETVLIGVNKYLNPKDEKLVWGETPVFMGVKTLVLEKELLENEN